MTAYLKVEFEVQNLKSIEQATKDLRSALQNAFSDIGFEGLNEPAKLVVNLEQPQDLAVVETAVVLGLIGIAKSGMVQKSGELD